MVCYLPSRSLIGCGCVDELGAEVKRFNFNKACVVTDKLLRANGIVKKVTDQLYKIDAEYVIYDEIPLNPSCGNVHDGVELFKRESCDFILTIGDRSIQNCASAISIVATNGGDIREYEGLHKSMNLGLPLIVVDTSPGTTAELSINYVIIDEDRGAKIVCADKNCTALLYVNDPDLIENKSVAPIAAAGMAALTLAIETIVTSDSSPITNATALEAVKIIFNKLPAAVNNGHDIIAREQLAYACILASMTSSNASLGFVHTMAHQLDCIYDLPHDVCNAMLLPVVERENAKYVPKKFRLIAAKLGFTLEGKTDKECSDFVLERIIELSEEVGMPKTLKELGVENPDLELLARNSLKEACTPGNPYMPTKEETIEMFKKIL